MLLVCVEPAVLFWDIFVWGIKYLKILFWCVFFGWQEAKLSNFLPCFPCSVPALQHWLGKHFYKREVFLLLLMQLFLIASSCRFLTMKPYAHLWSFLKKKSSSHFSDFAPHYSRCAQAACHEWHGGLAEVLFLLPRGLRYWLFLCAMAGHWLSVMTALPW